MPAYNSVFTEEKYYTLCGMPIMNYFQNKMPNLDHSLLKGGNLKEIEIDIIDEALIYFRANVLFRNFPVKSDADKLLIYITVFISKCLEVALSAGNDFDKAKNYMKILIDDCEWSPTLKSHFLNNLLNVQQNEVSELQVFLKGIRKETVMRLIYLLYDSETKTLDLKYWLGYGRKKFLGYDFPTTKIR